MVREHEMWKVYFHPLLSSFPPLLFLPLPSFRLLPFIFLSLPVMQLGSLGQRRKFPRGSGQSLADKQFLFFGEFTS